MNKIELYLKSLIVSPEKSIIKENEKVITAGQFLNDIQILAEKILLCSEQRWALCYQNSYFFIVSLFSVLISGKEPILLPNNQIGSVILLAKEYDAILTDISYLADYAFSFEKSNRIKKLVDLNINEKQVISFFTSGSTGIPKKISRSVRQIIQEITMLESSFGKQIKQNSVYSTVSHQHVYGFLFYILWPLCSERLILMPLLNYPEQIEALMNLDNDLTIISSPALLKRISFKKIDYSSSTLKKPLEKNSNTHIFSSGGPLDKKIALNINDSWGITPIEVFGSTETGGIAYRQQYESLASSRWTPFSGIHIATDENSDCLIVNSPLFATEKGLITADRAIIYSDGSFSLQDRADRVLKVEEKRVSLLEIENRLKQHDFVQDAYLVLLESNRQYLGAIIALTSEGRQQLASLGKASLNALFKTYLSPYFDNLVLPKRFRYVDDIPCNSQGKYVLSDLKQLFDSQLVRNAKLLESKQINNQQEWLLKLFISKELVFFEGHFPEYPILPGVVQIDWAINYASSFLNQKKENFLNIQQLKFKQAILPDSTVYLAIKLEKNIVCFQYFSDETVYSIGKIKLDEIL